MTIRQLNRTVAKWARKLGLEEQKWEIDAKFVTKDEQTDLGQILWVAERAYATLRIRSDADEPIEPTIVHELLHVRLEGHKPMEKVKFDVMFERGLDAIAEALMNEDQGGPQKGRK